MGSFEILRIYLRIRRNSYNVKHPQANKKPFWKIHGMVLRRAKDKKKWTYKKLAMIYGIKSEERVRQILSREERFFLSPNMQNKMIYFTKCLDSL